MTSLWFEYRLITRKTRFRWQFASAFSNQDFRRGRTLMLFFFSFIGSIFHGQILCHRIYHHEVSDRVGGSSRNADAYFTALWVGFCRRSRRALRLVRDSILAFISRKLTRVLAFSNAVFVGRFASNSLFLMLTDASVHGTPDARIWHLEPPHTNVGRRPSASVVN